MDNARALVTVGELAHFKEGHTVVLPNFDKEVCKHTDVIDGEEVMTLRLEEKGTENFS